MRKNLKNIDKTKNIFELQSEYKQKRDGFLCDPATLYNKICSFYDFIEDYKESKIVVTNYNDNDGHIHTIFVRDKDVNEDGTISTKILDKLKLFYDNIYFTGEICEVTTRLSCESETLQCHIRKDSKVSLLTVVSVILAHLVSNDLLIARMICDFLYQEN